MSSPSYDNGLLGDFFQGLAVLRDGSLWLGAILAPQAFLFSYFLTSRVLWS